MFGKILAHPYWVGIGVIVAIIFGVLNWPPAPTPRPPEFRVLNLTYHIENKGFERKEITLSNASEWISPEKGSEERHVKVIVDNVGNYHAFTSSKHTDYKWSNQVTKNGSVSSSRCGTAFADTSEVQIEITPADRSVFCSEPSIKSKLLAGLNSFISYFNQLLS